MQALKIDEQRALKLYPTAAPEFKAMLEDSFTKEFFSQKITDRVKTFTDACYINGVSPNSVEPYGGCTTGDQKSINAYAKLIQIVRALNEGWVPDWANSSQYKYFPWFKEKSGFGLSYYDYDIWDTYTNVGSRLCFKSSELAEYAGKQFEAIYRDYLSL